jgi:uncharacterized protein (TIGR01319 family)
MSAALLIDFGSTYTKLRAVDVEGRRLIGTGQGPSTVATDINIGMRAALADLERRAGALPRWRYRLASSSAAGGLRMVTIGLVRELTAEAARRAALGAGAKLVGTFAYRLTHSDLDEILRLQPDIVLLAGGTDGGNLEVVLHNAAALGASSLACPIVYAGNRAAEDEARRLLASKSLVCTENVMPELNELNIEPARAAIRQVFIERIVHAKGIDRAAAEFDAVAMPTPAAVLEAARLLADGVPGVSGLGSVLVVDPGGATTDVHSVASGEPAPGVIPQGLPEPRVKRTVEGDLGMRHNASTLVEQAGIAAIASDAGLHESEVRGILAQLKPEDLPSTAQAEALDGALARAAVGIAVQRHCGTLRTVYTPTGQVTVQQGKDLRRVDALIGTGGVLAASRDARAILRRALACADDPLSLRPVAPRLLLDREYVLYACGLLQSVDAHVAFELALAHLTEPDQKFADAAALGSAHPR